MDTNIVSGYLSVSFPIKAIQFLDGVFNSIPNLSVITEIELLSWDTDVDTEEKIKNFLSDSNIININPDIVIHCARLRKRKKIKTPDAIIAATAITYGFSIISTNEKDFSNIKGLKVINPKNL